MSHAVVSPAQFSARQRVVLLVLVGTGFMLSVDFSVLNVALPQIGEGLKVAMSEWPWINTAFVLPAAGFTLVCGRLADLVGRRRMLRIGLGLLFVGSMRAAWPPVRSSC